MIKNMNFYCLIFTYSCTDSNHLIRHWLWYRWPHDVIVVCSSASEKFDEHITQPTEIDMIPLEFSILNRSKSVFDAQNDFCLEWVWISMCEKNTVARCTLFNIVSSLYLVCYALLWFETVFFALDWNIEFNVEHSVRRYLWIILRVVRCEHHTVSVCIEYWVNDDAYNFEWAVKTLRKLVYF